MTQNQIDMYAKAAGINHWRFLGKAKAAYLIDLAYRRPLEHNWQRDGESIPIPNHWLKMFSEIQQNHLNGVVFQCTNTGNEKDVTCMAYRLNPKIRQQIIDMNYTPQTKGHRIDVSTGRRIVTIASTSTEGRKLPNVARQVKLHMRALSVGIEVMPKWIAYFQNEMRGDKPAVFASEMHRIVERKQQSNVSNRSIHMVMTEYCQRVEMEMKAFLDLASTHKHGMITQLYETAISGREYAQGLTLQNCTTLTRATALHGCYQLDFESCHPTIAFQLSKQWPDCPELKYLELATINKVGIRQQLHEQTGRPISAVKAALLMPMYGATKTLWHKGAYVSVLTRKGYLRIQRSVLFQKYVQDVELFQYHLLDKCRRNKKGRVINCLGLVSPVGSSAKYEVAHLMQGNESKAMAGAVSVTTSAVVWQHDAVICREPENIKDMEQAAKDAAGFDLKIERKRYAYSGLPAIENNG